MSSDKSNEALAWRTILNSSELSEEERRIVELLAEGNTQAEIARQLGLHRSAVWRRVKIIRTKRTPSS